MLFPDPKLHSGHNRNQIVNAISLYIDQFLLRVGLLALCLFISSNLLAYGDNASGAAPWTGDTILGAPCSGKSQGYGPFDYLHRHRLKNDLHLVESAHFNSNVESLVSGAKRGRALEWDIDYTLRAWPNHHRALYAVVRYRLHKGSYINAHLSPAECYLQRAINYSPSDGTSYMLYGLLLHKLNQSEKALIQYRKAHELQPLDAQTTYNLALLLTELGHYDEALEHAHHLYRYKFPLIGLKTKLQKKDAWKEIPEKSVTNSEDN